METKANHLMIGAFVLVLFVGIFMFLVWMARIQVDRDFAYYTVYFRDSVAGLGLGSDVRFNGIKVGSVKEIVIDRDDPSRVRVTLEVARNTPIKQDSYAILSPQGVTGLNFVQIVAQKSDAPLVPPRTAMPYPEIQSRPSTLGQLADQAPELLAKGIELLERATDMINPENQRTISKVLADVSQITGAIAARSGEIEKMMVSAESGIRDGAVVAKQMADFTKRLDKLGNEVETTLKMVQGTMGRADAMMTKDIAVTLSEARVTMKAFNKVAAEAEQLLNENQTALNDFASEGLGQFARLITEARILVQSLSRVAERIENDPAQFIFGGRAPERKAE